MKTKNLAFVMKIHNKYEIKLKNNNKKSIKYF